MHSIKPKPKPKAARKTRTKLRKQKYLSLRLQLTATMPPPPPPTTENKQLINLFPLHPENLYKDDHEHEHNMARIFSSCDDVDNAATTLTGILCSDEEEEEHDDQTKVTTNTNNPLIDQHPSPSSVNHADEEVELVRTAMRRNKYKTDNINNNSNIYNDDNINNEKWVYYSEVVERKNEIKGMSSSSSSTTRSSHYPSHHHRSKLVLKLDYEKIMKSWVNKGPLYVRGGDSGLDTPQTVPDLQVDDFFFPSFVNGTSHDEQDNGGNGGSWTVPEMTHTENNGVIGGDDALHTGDLSAMTHNREASVQRYKEKRRNRLFAKTIRYEVRKLNAEKRPRIKGRFVKRN